MHYLKNVSFSRMIRKQQLLMTNSGHHTIKLFYEVLQFLAVFFEIVHFFKKQIFRILKSVQVIQLLLFISFPSGALQFTSVFDDFHFELFDSEKLIVFGTTNLNWFFFERYYFFSHLLRTICVVISRELVDVTMTRFSDHFQLVSILLLIKRFLENIVSQKNVSCFA